MARSYLDGDDGRPSRPARRAESQRTLNQGYSAHYAESPVIRQGGERASRRPGPSRSSTLPRSEAYRSPSRHSRTAAQQGQVYLKNLQC